MQGMGFNPFKMKKSYLFLFLGAILAIWILFFDTYSIWTRYSLSQQKKELIHKTNQLEAETKKLKQNIKELENDTTLLNQIAREKYGMRKKGETIYKVELRD